MKSEKRMTTKTRRRYTDQGHPRESMRIEQEARAAKAKTRDAETGAGLFTPCCGVLREGVSMRYRAIQSATAAIQFG